MVRNADDMYYIGCIAMIFSDQINPVRQKKHTQKGLFIH